MDLFRTKAIGTDVHGETGLLRTLGAGDLVLLGIGAIIGALYAAGHRPDKIQEITATTTWRDVVDLSLRSGLMKGDRLHDLLEGRPDAVGAEPLAQFAVIFDNAVVNDGNPCLFIDGTVGLESRRCPDDIVAMPVARFLYGIHQRDMLLINTGRLPVHIGFIVKHIEHLNFIQALHKDTTVAPTLAFTFDDQRAAPFDVELVAFEMLARFNIALTGLDCHGTLFYGPSGRLV